MILSIDQEENKIDENKPNSNVKTSNTIDTSKLTALQQKLFEGIEKTKVNFFNIPEDPAFETLCTVQIIFFSGTSVRGTLCKN